MTPMSPRQQPMLFLALLVLQTTPIVWCQTQTSGWRDDYKLAYSYESSSSMGPLNWDQVPAAVGWGEWEVVRLASAQEPTNSDGLPLLSWSYDENFCGREERPSPIELNPGADCSDAQEMTVRIFNSELDCRHPLEENRRQGEEATDDWEITAYSLRYYYPRTDRVCRRPTVRLDNIDHSSRKNTEEHFVLLWLELHARSEHVIDGKRYDAELQMVHMATSRTDELVIVSVLIDASNTDDHLDFQRFLLDGWQRKVTQEAQTCSKKRQLQRERPHLRGENRNNPGYTAVLQDYLNGTLSIDTAFYDDPDEQQPIQRDLQGNRCTPDKYGNGCESQGLAPRKRMFPYNLWPSIWYYSYEGSITAPPCQGNVHWRIMDQPLTISRRQYKQLTSLLTKSRNDNCQFDTAASTKGENFRPLQTSQSAATQRQKENNNNKQNNPNNNQASQSVQHCTDQDFFASVYSGNNDD